MKTGVICISALLLAACSCRADSKPPPTEAIGYSADGRFIVRLASKVQVFTLDKEEKSYRLVSEFATDSGSAPLKALISDDGSYVVTLDGFGMGRGNDVVVAYKRDGTKLKSWRLDEILTKEDFAAVPSSVSSDWWRQEALIAYSPPQLIVTGPNDQIAASKKRYWYQLDLATLVWSKKR